MKKLQIFLQEFCNPKSNAKSVVARLRLASSRLLVAGLRKLQHTRTDFSRPVVFCTAEDMAAMMLASMWTPTRPSSTRNWGLRRRQQQECWSASSLGSGIAETRTSSNSRSVMCCCYESSTSVQNRSVTMAVILPLAACSLLAIFPAPGKTDIF
jgi:hypothetical protein